jgi:type I restriction enzyme M protein
VEQFTYPPFLKMANARSGPPYSQPSLVLADYARPTLLPRDGDAVFDHYPHALEEHGDEKGTLERIFGN